MLCRLPVIFDVELALTATADGRGLGVLLDRGDGLGAKRVGELNDTLSHLVLGRLGGALLAHGVLSAGLDSAVLGCLDACAGVPQLVTPNFDLVTSFR